jgi:hypothetical protein
MLFKLTNNGANRTTHCGVLVSHHFKAKNKIVGEMATSKSQLAKMSTYQNVDSPKSQFTKMSTHQKADSPKSQLTKMSTY